MEDKADKIKHESMELFKEITRFLDGLPEDERNGQLKPETAELMQQRFGDRLREAMPDIAKLNAAVEKIKTPDFLKEQIVKLDPDTIAMLLERYGDVDTCVEKLKDNDNAYLLLAGIPGIEPAGQKGLLLKYGLADGVTRTTEEAAELVGVTKEHMAYYESRALGHYKRKTLRDHLADQGEKNEQAEPRNN